MWPIWDVVSLGCDRSGMVLAAARATGHGPWEITYRPIKIVAEVVDSALLFQEVEANPVVKSRHFPFFDLT